MNKQRLPEGVRFGYTNPYNMTPNITWSMYTLGSKLATLGLLYADREMSLSEPFSAFRKSSYYTPPTADECQDMDKVYRRVAIDFAKYMRDNYE